MDLSRENILERVRAALRAEARRPVAPTSAEFWPPVGNTQARFREEFVSVRGELLPDAEALQAFLGGFSRVATDGSELVRGAVGERDAIARDCELGVTGCDCLIAQTGSIVVSSQSSGGRILSVLPPAHLVIARRDQLVPDLAAALALLRQRYGGSWRGTISFITGPSRTADIEKILVMGAHGPKRLALYFV